MSGYRRYKGPVWEHASAEERLLLLEGVGSRFWHPLRSIPEFCAIQIPDRRNPKKKVTIAPERQLEAYKALLRGSEEALTAESLIVIGAQETDELAFHLAIDLVRGLLLNRPPALRAKLVTLGNIPDPKEQAEDGERTGSRWWSDLDEAAVLVFHNVLDTTEDRRVQQIRDIMRRNPETTFILVLAGADPFEFCTTRLRVSPSVLLDTFGPSAVRTENR